MLNKKKTDMETEGVAGAASPWNTIPFLIWIKRNMAAMVALVFLCIGFINSNRNISCTWKSCQCAQTGLR